MTRKPICFDSSIDTYVGCPDYRKLGFSGVSLVSAWGLNKTLPDGSIEWGRIDPETCRYAANHPTWWTGREKDMIVLDEETLDHHHPDFLIRDANHDQLIEAVRIYRESHPGNAIGVYGIMPERNYASMKPNSPEGKVWKQRNRELLSNIDNGTGKKTKKSLSAIVDRVFCSCYGWEDYPIGWENWIAYSTNSIKEATIYDKPVFVYLCPQKEPATGEPFVHYTNGTWKKMLDWSIANPLVDGVVIYQVVQPETVWNESAPW